MDNIIIEKEDLESIVSSITKKMKLYGPVLKQGGVTFDKVESFLEIVVILQTIAGLISLKIQYLI